MTTITQEELDRIAQQEADELLAAHQTKVPMTAEQIAAAEAEKALLASRAILNSDPQEGAPRARRHGSQRPTGFPEDDEPAPQAPEVVVMRTERPTSGETYGRGPGLDFSKLDPTELSRLAYEAKVAEANLEVCRVQYEAARAEHEKAAAAFLSYLQQ